MTFLSTLLTDGWPILFALALVFLITYGALRPHMKKDAARRNRKEDTSDE